MTTMSITTVIQSAIGIVRVGKTGRQVRTAWLRRNGEVVYRTSAGKIRPADHPETFKLARDTGTILVAHDRALAEDRARTVDAGLAAALLNATECASCGTPAAGTVLVARDGDIVCLDAGACVDRRTAEIIDGAHAEALLVDANRGRTPEQLETELDRAAQISPAHAELADQLKRAKAILAVAGLDETSERPASEHVAALRVARHLDDDQFKAYSGAMLELATTLHGARNLGILLSVAIRNPGERLLASDVAELTLSIYGPATVIAFTEGWLSVPSWT